MSQQTAVMASLEVRDVFDRHPLNAFLDARRANGKEPTMTGMGIKKGAFHISDADYPEFLNHLHYYLFEKKQIPMNFVEQSRSDSAKPILIDLDFKYPVTANHTRKFTESHIKGFIHQVVEGLKAFFDLSSYEEGIRMFVTLRQGPYKAPNGVLKDGIHIECPDLCLSNEKQKVLRNWLMEARAVMSAFEGTGYSNTPEDIYDSSMVRKQGWFFYGESKPSIDPYKLTHVFAYEPLNDEIVKRDITVYTPRELMELLSIRYNLVPDDNEVRGDAKELYARMLSWKPVASPVAGGATAAAPPPLNLGAAAVPQGEMEVIVKSMLSSLRGCTPEDVPFIRRLVMECLSVDRANDYGKWIEVGLCLHNISSSAEMDDKLFTLWMDFSQKSAKAGGNNELQLRREWNRWHRGSSERMLKWTSLQRWAREDSPVRYKEILDEDLLEYIILHVMPTHYFIATVMQKMFGHQFRASIESKRTEWFVYSPEDHVWKHINQGIALRAKISTDVAEMFARAKKIMITRERNADGDLSDTGKMKVKDFNLVEKSLYTANFKDSVMKECSGLFYEEDFMNKLNLNPYLIVCKNGVLNLRAVRKNADGKDEMYVEFRSGKPEDMMTFIAGREYGVSEPLDYRPLDRTDSQYQELQEFLDKIFPYADLRDYAITLFSTCLEGMNREQCYYTLQGKGGNGKSKILDLMRMVLGDYQSSLAPTALTRKRPESGAANPDIINIKNKRFIYLSEPDAKEPLNTSRMKQFSGEDVVEARGLFQDQEKFKISGKLFMLCNDLPPIHAMDRGTWRRVRLLPFPSIFVGEGDIDFASLREGKPNYFPKDVFLDEKLKRWREVFLGLLVHTYENVYCRQGLKEPAIIRDASNSYKQAFDSFAKFRAARIRVDPAHTADFNVISRAFKEWLEWQGAGEKRLSNQDLRKRLEDEFGMPEGGKNFRGIMVFSDAEAVDAWDKERA